jgi:RNA polymerase sigma factor (sigma-70 family)
MQSEWVQAAQQGDRDAFNALIERYGAAARRWAFALLHDEQAAEDAAQEAFLTAYRKIGQLREPVAFAAWLKRIVLSECSRMTRRKAPEIAAMDDDTPAPPDADPARDAEERERRDQVRRAVDRLPAHERQVTELFYVYGYSLDEIAHGLELPLTTVKKRLQYAREHLRENMPMMRAVPADMQIAALVRLYRRYQLERTPA